MNPWTGAKKLARATLPKAWLERLVQRYFRLHWAGDYPSWTAACADAGGYDAPAILARVLAANRQVRDGQAAYERDGVVFAEPAVNPPLLAGLQAAVVGGRLSVLDFGGALGSTYWQHRVWLDTVPVVHWSVVEQAHYVRAGRTEFAGERLRFYLSVEECLGQEKPQVLLLSSVVPYLAEPHVFLADMAGRGFGHILIDRTGIIDRPADRLTVQHVPRSIYAASYPCWFFNRDRLLAHFASGYELLHEYTNEDGAGSGAVFQGFHLRRRPNA